MIILPRQARDKHRVNFKKRTFFAGGTGSEQHNLVIENTSFDGSVVWAIGPASQLAGKQTVALLRRSSGGSYINGVATGPRDKPHTKSEVAPLPPVRHAPITQRARPTFEVTVSADSAQEKLCNILEHGAKADGVTDDAEAFHRAIAAACVTIFLPNTGRPYLLGSTVNLSRSTSLVVRKRLAQKTPFLRHFVLKNRTFAKTGSGQTHREKLHRKRRPFLSAGRELQHDRAEGTRGWLPGSE
jgi:hypothetical protein